MSSGAGPRRIPNCWSYRYFFLDADDDGFADFDADEVAEGDAVAVFVGVGGGVTDGFGAGPFSSAAAIAAFHAASVGEIDFPLTLIVGVEFTPPADACSVIASTIALCC
jgi:hypothetical protein